MEDFENSTWGEGVKHYETEVKEKNFSMRGKIRKIGLLTTVVNKLAINHEFGMNSEIEESKVMT